MVLGRGWVGMRDELGVSFVCRLIRDEEFVHFFA